MAGNAREKSAAGDHGSAGRLLSEGRARKFYQTGIRQIAAGLVVAVTYKWKHNTLFSILIGTVVYMVLLWMR